ncbi:MAG: hypothetical protein ACYDGR_00940 [Candidatus Dormibacteria bacterium]
MVPGASFRVRLATTSPANLAPGTYRVSAPGAQGLHSLAEEVRREARDAVLVAPASALRDLLEELLDIQEPGRGNLEVIDGLETVLLVTPHRLVLRYLNRGAAG